MYKEFHLIFEKLVGKLNQEYDLTKGIKPAGPNYTPISKTSDPQPLSIDEYKKRKTKPKPIPTAAKKKSREGRQKKLRKKRSELRRLIDLNSGQQKQNFFEELKALDDGQHRVCTSTGCQRK